MVNRVAQRGKRVSFEVTAESKADVFVAGSFNGWNPAHNKLKEKTGSGVYRTTLVLARGRHEYKFVVNGAWRADPRSSELAPDGYGTHNSVVNVA
jgi:1,4-alpha-glucan branching enzyme